jgi:hypothetical protein
MQCFCDYTTYCHFSYNALTMLLFLLAHLLLAGCLAAVTFNLSVYNFYFKSFIPVFFLFYIIK